MSKDEIFKRNEKIFSMSKEGAKQTEIANKFGVSAQRIGQILLSHKKPTKNLKKKAINVINQVSKPSFKNDLVAAIISSDMKNEIKLELLKNFI